jgi:hypothetical protein
MNNKILLIVLVLILFSIPLISAATTHCGRVDASRSANPSFIITGQASVESYQNQYKYLIPLSSIINISGFGSYVFQCDDGASWASLNYFAIFDTTTNSIIATNVPGNGGPAGSGGGMCVDSSGAFCYILNGQYYPAYGTCDASPSYSQGYGTLDPLLIPMTESWLGAHSIDIKLGTIAPTGVASNSPLITYRSTLSTPITFYVGQPSLLVFSQQKLGRLNFTDTSGTATQTVKFTLINKSPYTEKIRGFKINCSDNVACTIPNSNLYTDFEIPPNQANVFFGEITFDKKKIPLPYHVSLDVNYSANGLSVCDTEKNTYTCATHSAQTIFESGLLDQQSFQISVIKQTQQRECINAEGDVGQTGPQFAPRVNFYFGGNVAPGTNPYPDSKIISIDECTPKDYDTGATNPDWVFCSQREFLVELAERVAKALDLQDQIRGYQSAGNDSAADELIAKKAKLLSFDAYLREQSISPTKISSSVNKVNTNYMFTDIGLIAPFTTSGLLSQKTRFANFINGITFQQTSGDQQVLLEEEDGYPVEAGLYHVIVTISGADSLSKELLFDSSDNLNTTIKINVLLNRDSTYQPPFDWFFYHNESSDDLINVFTSTSGRTIYRTNVIDRGSILDFREVNGEIDGNFFATFAVPLIIRLADTNGGGVVNTTYKVTQGDGDNRETFTYWTGIASSLGDGCQTTVSTAQNNKSLPYRLPDSSTETQNATGSYFNINELENVTPNSVMYLNTVLYLPIFSTETGSIILDTPFNLYSRDNTCLGTTTNKCTYSIQLSNPTNYSTYKVRADPTYVITDLFNGIDNNAICVYKDASTQEERWKVFWNQEKISDSLSNVKSAITDAKICTMREGLSS